MSAAIPSPSDHAEMPKRVTGRRLVRTCSCGKPWPCDQARWNQLREKVTYQRDVKRDQADREGNARLHGAAEALDWILATMDRMEADRR